ncbi:hypothetical protein [Nocardia sp. NRRL S-836]|uniref:hypothetical protein n=1 Tax=Nocardia sp. NRRL S-836 TaxID=1519492 RepID=UPI000AED219E|nr:hypothetical protein [Nocardia sp. NRRL S-836]
MPWVQRHRRRTPYSWFRSTTVRSHYRRRPLNAWLPLVVVIAFIVLLIAIF